VSDCKFLPAPTSAIRWQGENNHLCQKRKPAPPAPADTAASQPHDLPILVILVMGVIVLGMFQYTGLLVVGSVIFVGFFAGCGDTPQHGFRYTKRRLRRAPSANRARVNTPLGFCIDADIRFALRGLAALLWALSRWPHTPPTL